MNTLKNDLSIIKSLLSSKSKEDFRHGERISESPRFMEKETMGYALLGRELLYHLKVCESFKGEFMRGITACHLLSFTRHSHD
jgi:hypothetical protein